MKKKLLFRGLALVTVLMTALSAHADYALERDGIYYNLIDDGNGNTAAEVTYEDTYYNSYSWSVTIPGTIIQSWFHGNEIPVISIGQYAFRNCSDLTHVQIGYNVEHIGFDAFWNCTRLYSLVIPDNVKTIDNWAFEGCSGLNIITLGSGITSIGGSAFSGCSNLHSVFCEATTPPTITSSTFPSTVTSNATLIVPSPAYILVYQSANYWKNFSKIEAESTYDFVYNGIYYAITSSNTVAVASYNHAAAYSGSVTIPATVTYGGKTYKVTKIDDGAFWNCHELTAVTIGSNVTEIGDYAFSETSLAKVIIPDNVKTIGHFAFYDIPTLKEVTIGKAVTTIYNNAFAEDDALIKVTVLATTPPNNISGFSENTYLNGRLIVPRGCYNAYYSANIWNEFQYIYEMNYDFYVNGIYYKKTSSNTASVCRSIDEPSGDYTGTVTIPATVTYNGTTYKVTGIDESAFCLSAVTKVNIGSNVTTIGNSAFLMSGLTSITIPNTVTSIGVSAFESCDRATSLSIGSGITTISNSAFWGCNKLTTITIPNNVKTIGNQAFYECDELKNLTIGTGVTSIGEEAFYDCYSLTSVTIPNNVKTIGKSAFNYCRQMTTLNIGSGVTSIASQAFYNCSALTTIKCDATTPPTIQSNTFYPSSIYSNATLTVPSPAAVTAYKAANYWKNFTKILAAHEYDFVANGIYYKITGTNTVSVTYKDTNYNSYTTSTVTIPAAVTYGGTTYTVTAIGDNAFRKCTSLTKVTIGSNVTTIGQYAFYSSGLTTVTIPDKVTTIKTYAFGSCNSLASVTIGTGVTSIATYAFANCNALTAINCNATTPPTIQSTTFSPSSIYSNATLTVPTPAAVTAYKAANYWKNFTKILAAHEYDFVVNGIYYKITGTNTVSVTYKDTNYNSYTVSTVTIPATVTYQGTSYKVTAIGEHAFRKCTALTKVTIGSNVTSIGQYAFYNSGLKTATIPDKVVSIKTCAFASCSNLTTVTIGKGVTSIAAQSFDSPLTSVTCNATTPPTMSNTNAFRTSTYDNATLYVPAASLSAYKSASGWRYFAKIQAIGGSSIGDMNGDGNVDVADVTALIAAILNGNYVSPAVGDINGDGNIDVADTTMLINRILNGN